MAARLSASVILAALVLPAPGCGVLSVEEQVLTDFFHASRLRDTTMAARVSTVEFNPRTDGTVEHFDVVRTEIGRGAGPDTRHVTVAARVRPPEGTLEDRTIMATLQRGADGRWRVTSLE
jgi:hypothetical protein